MTNEDYFNLIETIAKKHFSTVETLKTRKSDSLDFHDVAIWNIKAALDEAFRSGATFGHSIGYNSQGWNLH